MAKRKTKVQVVNENQVFIDDKPVTILRSNTSLKQLKENLRILKPKSRY